MKNNILFLCTGNYYRSKFAEIYFNFLSDKYHKSWKAFSRGFFPDNPTNTGWISPLAVERLTELGVPIPEESSPKLLSAADLQKSHLVVVLSDEEHRPFVKKFFPKWENRFTYWHIFDKQDISPVIALNELQRNIEELVGDFTVYHTKGYPFYLYYNK